jgi:hypothetical protein
MPQTHGSYPLIKQAANDNCLIYPILFHLQLFHLHERANTPRMQIFYANYGNVYSPVIPSLRLGRAFTRTIFLLDDFYPRFYEMNSFSPRGNAGSADLV